MKRLLLLFTAFSCITIWGFLIAIVLDSNNDQNSGITYQKVEKRENETTIPASIEIEPKQSNTERLETSLKENGLRKEDIIQIAPNGVISIDDLLSIVIKDQH